VYDERRFFVRRWERVARRFSQKKERKREREVRLKKTQI